MRILFDVKIRHPKTSPQNFGARLRGKSNQIEALLMEYGKQIGNRMSNYINKNRHRRRTREKDSLASFLRNNVKVVKRGGRFVVGVGDLNELSTRFPYWKVLNFGGYVPKITVGYFGNRQPPRGDMVGGSEAWHTRPDGYVMKPKNPIRPIRYLNDAVRFARWKWRTTWSRQIKALWSKKKR